MSLHKGHQWRSFLWLQLLAAVLCPLSRSQTQPRVPDRQALIIDKLFRQEFAKDRTGALTVGLVKEGKLVWTKSYGFVDQEHHTPAGETTIYGIGSVTKVLTGITLLQLVERGKVHLTDSVEKYFPEVNLIPKKYPWSPPITLIQLATMTAGLQATSSTVGDPYAFGPPSEWQKLLIASLPHAAYVYEPGTRRLYSNISYSILAAAIERAAGKPYLDYVQEEVLQPLGMTSTSFFLTADLAPRVAKGYYLGTDKIDPDFPQQQNGHQGYWTPVGGALSTVSDLAKLMRFQLGYGPNSVLKPETLESAFTGLIASDADLLYGDGVGFSASRNDDGHLVVLGHGGLRRGYIASYEFDRSTKTGIIVLSSSSGGRAEYKPLVRRILSMLNPHGRGGTGEPLQEMH
jgi:CubicO group peptidase (beta-lactamase class C family)